MKKILIFIIIFLPINSFSSEKIINSLKNGKKIVFIRHAIAPGNGDPDNFDISDNQIVDIFGRPIYKNVLNNIKSLCKTCNN